MISFVDQLLDFINFRAFAIVFELECIADTLQNSRTFPCRHSRLDPSRSLSRIRSTLLTQHDILAHTARLKNMFPAHLKERTNDPHIHRT